jgi:hypothetical protein
MRSFIYVMKKYIRLMAENKSVCLYEKLAGVCDSNIVLIKTAVSRTFK